MADQLHGATISFSSTFFAEITNISWDGMSRQPIETTHSGTTTFKTFRPSDLVDVGSITVQGHFDHDKNAEVPMTGNAETVTIHFPLDTGETTASTWVCSGFMTEFSWEGGTVDDPAASYSATIKLTGDPTFTAAT